MGRNTGAEGTGEDNPVNKVLALQTPGPVIDPQNLHTQQSQVCWLVFAIPDRRGGGRRILDLTDCLAFPSYYVSSGPVRDPVSGKKVAN